MGSPGGPSRPRLRRPQRPRPRAPTRRAPRGGSRSARRGPDSCPRRTRRPAPASAPRSPVASRRASVPASSSRPPSRRRRAAPPPPRARGSGSGQPRRRMRRPAALARTRPPLRRGPTRSARPLLLALALPAVDLGRGLGQPEDRGDDRDRVLALALGLELLAGPARTGRLVVDLAGERRAVLARHELDTDLLLVSLVRCALHDRRLGIDLRSGLSARADDVDARRRESGVLHE